MIKVLETAIEKLKTLPRERQAYVAHVLEQIATASTLPFKVPDGHQQAILKGADQADRGEFASDIEMAALWKKCSL